MTLLLIYLYRQASERRLPVTTTIEPLIFSDDFGERKFNLDIAERVPVIRALFNGEDYNAEGKDESIQTIVARYEDVQGVDLADDLGESLQTFIYWLINKVGLNRDFNRDHFHLTPIFETMNDRGKPLSPVDMLKAYLLAPIEDGASRSEANRAWKQTVLDLISWGSEPDPERDATFMKAWLRAQYAESIRDRRAGAFDKDWELVGTTFHRWYRDNADRIGAGTTAQNLRVMVEEVPSSARAYRRILDATRDLHGRSSSPGVLQCPQRLHVAADGALGTPRIGRRR